MAGSRTPALLAATLLAGGLGGCAAETGLSQSIPAPAIDCSRDARALWDLEPTVQHREGHELHQFWLLADRPDLWLSEVPAFDALLRYRQQAREVELMAEEVPALARATGEADPRLHLDHDALPPHCGKHEVTGPV